MATDDQAADDGATATGSDSQSQTADEATKTKPDEGTTAQPDTLEAALGELASLRKSLKESNAESRQRRQQIKELEKFKTEREDAEKTELEKVKGEQAKATEQINALKARLVEKSIQAVAAQLGFKRPDVASRLIKSDELEFDDDGEPENVKELLSELLKDMPELAGKTKATSDQSTNPASSADKAAEKTKLEQTINRSRFLKKVAKEAGIT